SPDGSRLCYATNYTGEWNDYHLVDLFVLDLTTGATVKLVERPGGKIHPRWSPDGTQIAFLSWLDPQLSYSRHSLFVVEVPPHPLPPVPGWGGGDPRVLTVPPLPPRSGITGRGGQGVRAACSPLPISMTTSTSSSGRGTMKSSMR